MQIEDRLIIAEKIKSAFKDVSLPSYVGYGLDELEGKKWDEVSVEDLRDQAENLNGFTSEGFLYFLPAMLTAIILHSEEADVLTDNIIAKLAPPIQEHRNEKWFEALQIKFNKWVGVLDIKQKEVIREFVYCYKDLEPAGGWSFMDTDKVALESAIEFWT